MVLSIEIVIIRNFLYNFFMKIYIKEALKMRKIAQKQMADYLAVPENTFSNWVRCVNEPDFEILIKIAKYLNVSTDYLLLGTDYQAYQGLTKNDFQELKYHQKEINKILDKYK